MNDLVIIGGGPTALRALAELEEVLAASSTPVPRRRPRIVLLEPAVPGAGAVWDPTQPEHLILNADAGIVDLRCPSIPLNYRDFADDTRSFPPRASVGSYLAWCFERLRTSAHWELVHLPHRASAVIPCEDAFDVRLDSSVSVKGREVLLATGHAPHTQPDHVALSSVSSRRLTDPVVVKGASLTAFDVVADLTQGRGGSFLRAKDGCLAYVPGGSEPRLITLWSRSGQTMLPKPRYSTTHEAAAVRGESAALRSLPTPDLAWWAALRRAAQAAAASHSISIDADTLDRVWDASPSPPGDVGVETADRWTHDLNRAEGRVDADARWWWGRAWACGYQDIVAGLDRQPRSRETWERFGQRAALLERWAFGPPADTIERLLALRRAGLLTCHRSPSQPNPSALTIDAVTPRPGVLREPRAWAPASPPAVASAQQELWSQLLGTGQVMVRPGERGVLTRPDGRCVPENGGMTPVLCALGRPTEDPTLGHDSLQRAFRPEFKNWATGWSQRLRSTHDIHQGAVT